MSQSIPPANVASITTCPTATTANWIAYSYDTASRLATKTVVNQTQIVTTFDPGNRLTNIAQGTATVAIKYDNDDRRHTVTFPAISNGSTIVATYAWDNASELQGITYTNVPTSGSPTTLGNVSYTYDPAGHVITRGGTLFQSIQAGAITAAAYNNGNRLISQTAANATVTPSWDGNGNLVCDNYNASTATCTGRTFTWDSRNRLTGISPAGTETSFTYDMFNRRLSKGGIARLGGGTPQRRMSGSAALRWREAATARVRRVIDWPRVACVSR